MNITTTGSLGNVGKPLVEALVAMGHTVTVISSNAAHTSAIEALGARAATGEISDTNFLKQAFTGADAVYTMTPPAMGSENIIDNIANAGLAYLQAIKASGVKRVVMLSSIGAHATAGTGPVQGAHRVEQLFRQLTGVNLTIIRAGIFYINFFRDIPVIRNSNVIGNNYQGDDKLVLAHPRDVAAAIAAELENKGNGIEVKYIASAITTGNEVARVLGHAVGKPDLQWVSFPDEQLRQGMLSAGLPPELAALLIEMGKAVRAGTITEDFFATGGRVTGKVTLPDFAEEFKARYQQA